MKQFLLLLITGFWSGSHCWGSDFSFNALDDDSLKTSSVTVSGDYSTNTNTFGRFDNLSTQPSFSPAVMYLSKYNFNLGATGYFIGNSDKTGTETTSELDMQAGYVWELSKVFSVQPGYTHFFYSDNATTLKRSYDDYAQLSVNADVKWWNNSISAKYLWGTYDEIMLTAQTGVSVTFDNVLHKGNSLVLGPTVDVNMSNINYLRYISGRFKFLRTYSEAFPNATVNDLLNDLKYSSRPLIRRLAERLTSEAYLQKRLNTLSVDRNLVISSLFDDSKKMDFCSLGLTLPVYYYFGNFMATGTFAAYKPFNQPKMFGNDWTFYFGIGLSYTFTFGQGQNSFK
jgi:hypothetical protein